MFKKLGITGLAIASALVTAMLMQGCGGQQFTVAASTSSLQSPGSYVIPPKVDILLVEDDTGSITQAYSQIAQQIPSFLTGLQNKKWDYHLATIPLTQARSSGTPLQVMASVYDPNWGSEWIPPYPGASSKHIAPVAPWAFKKPANYSQFLTTSDINYGIGSVEPGLDVISRAVTDSFQMKSNGFMRSDAISVILLIGNGDDTSMVNLCTRVDGYVGPCEQTRGYPACSDLSQYTSVVDGAKCGTLQLSQDYYRAKLLSAKQGNASLMKFYAAVASQSQSGCLGAVSRRGDRYIKIAQAMGGSNYDICSQPIPTVLDLVSNDLQGVRGTFVSRYVFVEQEPDLSTVEIIKYLGGNTDRGVKIQPESADPANGYRYLGYQTLPAISAPTEMNYVTGYAFELLGSSVLHGNDAADVNTKPAGAKDTGK